MALARCVLRVVAPDPAYGRRWDALGRHDVALGNDDYRPVTALDADLPVSPGEQLAEDIAVPALGQGATQ